MGQEYLLGLADTVILLAVEIHKVHSVRVDFDQALRLAQELVLATMVDTDAKESQTIATFGDE